MVLKVREKSLEILVVCQYYHPEPFRITDICESLVENGHDVTVLTGLPNYPEGKINPEFRLGKKRNETINGVKIQRCFEIGRGRNNIQLFLNYLSFTVSGTIKALFLKKEFDVVFVNQLSPITMAIPAVVYSKKNKKKTLLYCLDLWPASLSAGGIRKNSYIYKLFTSLSKRIYSSVDSIAVSSNMFKNYFKNELDIMNSEIFHLPQYAESLFSESVIKNYEDIEKNGFNFVFAGNIGDMQSVETIIKTADILKGHSNITFHIVGDGSKLNECKKLTQHLGLTNIVFYGRRSITEMPKFYNLADAMLLTLKDNESISYTLPGKVQSYMAASKPIIAAINGEASHVIKDSKCGYCCEAEDYHAMAKLIIRFTNSSLERKIMSENSFAYYRKYYSKDIFINTLEEKLKKMEANNV